MAKLMIFSTRGNAKVEGVTINTVQDILDAAHKESMVPDNYSMAIVFKTDSGRSNIMDAHPESTIPAADSYIVTFSLKDVKAASEGSLQNQVQSFLDTDTRSALYLAIKTIQNSDSPEELLGLFTAEIGNYTNQKTAYLREKIQWFLEELNKEEASSSDAWFSDEYIQAIYNKLNTIEETVLSLKNAVIDLGINAGYLAKGYEEEIAKELLK